MGNRLKNTYCHFIGFIQAKLAWIPPLLARVTIGLVFIESGWGKLHNLDKVIAFFTELHIPAPAIQAPFVATVELVGGTAVLLGLFTRVASIPLIGTMVVAILTAKLPDLMGVSDLFGFIEYLYILLLVYLVIEGPGCFSIDHLLCNKFCREDKK